MFSLHGYRPNSHFTSHHMVWTWRRLNINAFKAINNKHWMHKICFVKRMQNARISCVIHNYWHCHGPTKCRENPEKSWIWSGKISFGQIQRDLHTTERETEKERQRCAVYALNRIWGKIWYGRAKYAFASLSHPKMRALFLFSISFGVRFGTAARVVCACCPRWQPIAVILGLIILQKCEHNLIINSSPGCAHTTQIQIYRIPWQCSAVALLLVVMRLTLLWEVYGAREWVRERTRATQRNDEKIDRVHAMCYARPSNERSVRLSCSIELNGIGVRMHEYGITILQILLVLGTGWTQNKKTLISLCSKHTYHSFQYAFMPPFCIICICVQWMRDASHIQLLGPSRLPSAQPIARRGGRDTTCNFGVH